MKKEKVEKIINQIRNYHLEFMFSGKEEFMSWVMKLNNRQLNNFLSLDIDYKEVINILELLVNQDLLNCDDYKKRVEALATIKTEISNNVISNLCDSNFLNSKYFYTDIEKISSSKDPHYALTIISNTDFINSPYHNEDLDLILNAKDTKELGGRDALVSAALSKIAINPYSINSKYHKEDMELVSTSGSDFTQSLNSFPISCLNILALNEDSLNDPYHLENMKLLLNYDLKNEILYKLMTDSDIINGEHYRKEIDAIIKAKSLCTARALYYYIVNPTDKFQNDYDSYGDYRYSYNARIKTNNLISGKSDPNYLGNLTLINEIDDQYIMHFVSLLMNPDFINSKNKEFDIAMFKKINSEDDLSCLYRLFIDPNLLESPYHVEDVIMISESNNEQKRRLLIDKACEDLELNNQYHRYDMKYISNIDFDTVNPNIYNKMYHELFYRGGINNPDRINRLNSLAKGTDENDLDYFFDNIDTEYDKYIGNNTQEPSNNGSLIRKLFQGKKGR